MLTVQFRFLSRYFLLPAIILWAFSASAQVTEKNPDQVYGYDPLLYNGMAYYYYAPPHTTGTQYLLTQFDTDGTITLRGITYSHLALNFDIFNQQLVLKYTNSIGSPALIQVSFAWLEAFEIEGLHFEIIASADSTKEIYQVLGAGSSKILYSQNKKLLIENFKSTDRYFSRIQRLMFVYNGTRKIKYNNNRTFVAAFAQAQRDLIRKYIRKHNLMVQKATDQQMTELINYCNTLSGT